MRRHSRGDRFAGDPAAQIARTARLIGERRPVVVRRRHRRMVAVREVPRFRLEPHGVRGVRRASPATATARARRRPPGSGGAACGVLRIPTPSPAAAASRADAPAAPASGCTWTGAGPSRGRLSPMHPRSHGSTERPSHLRLGKDLLGRRGELGNEGDVGQHGDLDLPDGERQTRRAAADEASDGTCTVTETTRQSVLGRVFSPVVVQSCRAAAPRRGSGSRRWDTRRAPVPDRDGRRAT